MEKISFMFLFLRHEAGKKFHWKRREIRQWEDYLEPRADEGRGKLRKAMGRCTRSLIHRFPNGGTQQRITLLLSDEKVV